MSMSRRTLRHLRDNRAMANLSRHGECCEMMRRQLDWSCDQHSDPFACPDALIGLFEDGRTGIIVHDGGASMVLISHCPWCGTPTGTAIEA
jgi:hypothetical protein